MNQEKIKIAIVGASGYAGGELLRILLNHPLVEVVQATSRKFFGKKVALLHPNLRGLTDLKFCQPAELVKCDLLILATPHGEVMGNLDHYLKLADKIIDLSADFRLKNPADYPKWYKLNHPAPNYLPKFIGGLAELYREQIKTANLVSCYGCEATCAILGLYPLFKEGVVENHQVFLDVKIGSSAAGAESSSSSHHPERAGAVRSYKPTGHRHMAEISQELGSNKVYLSATAIEMVRGILITSQILLNKDLTEEDILGIYRKFYLNEPFIRIIRDKMGLYRFPEPKILAGSNFCDIGFEKEQGTNRLVVVSAIDNLVKGTAGQAIQALNIMYGFEERIGLEFPGLHPI
ncbi:MAG: N-acetyl-gamma-glutamyl-phosphate reductase [Patescibacteria group bacterium]|jgi:N-acetyl-gamma-glutamyl-phosphate/LysW-gamma-L-alpha-aminoadipyl-6-phosphate reductase